MDKRDKRYILAFLLAVGWFTLLRVSGCELLDSPLGFVKGCYNYGINWNSFMAPTGFFAVMALPFCILFFISRLTRVIISSIKNCYKTLNNKFN